MSAIFEIEGYHVVLPHVQNVYPPEKDVWYWHWGFKYGSGVFEFFNYQTEEEAQDIHGKFVMALDSYWQQP